LKSTFWVFNNLIVPLGEAIAEYVTSGTLWDHLLALGGMFLEALKFGITMLTTIGDFVLNNLIIPMGLAIAEYVGSGQLWEHMLALGSSIMDAIAVGIGNVGVWAYDNIVQPIIDAVSSIDIGGMLGGLNPFGGGRANGGPVAANTPYLVGERGPELFVPSSSGNIGTQ